MKLNYKSVKGAVWSSVELKVYDLLWSYEEVSFCQEFDTLERLYNLENHFRQCVDQLKG